MTEADADRRLVLNERSKLTAAYLNGLAVALVAIGGFQTLFAASDGMDGGDRNPLSVAIHVTLCLTASGVLRFVARTMLRGLRQ